MFKTLSLSILILMILSVFLIWFFQRDLMYFPDRQRAKRKQYHATHMDELSLTTKDGLNLYAWYKKPTTKKITVVYFHGNAGHLGDRMVLIHSLLAKGYGALILSYRGYAGNPGKPTEQGLYNDARATIDYLKSKKQNNLVIFGESIGTGVASKIAVEYDIKALILQAPFKSMTAVAKFHYPWVIISPTDKYETIKRIDKIKVPLLIIHGKKDNIVPFKQAKQVFDAATTKDKKFLIFENKNHNDLWSESFLSSLLSFLDRIDKE